MSIGWVNVFNPIDTNLTIEKVMQGKYIILGIRKDRKSLPAALLKAQLNEALRAQLRERRGKKLSREEVASLKETVKEQMLAAVRPTTNLYEAVWNFETQDVYFSAQAGKIAVEFAELFEETFGLSLTEVALRPRRSLRGIQGPRHFPRRALPRAFRAVRKRPQETAGRFPPDDGLGETILAPLQGAFLFAWFRGCRFALC